MEYYFNILILILLVYAIFHLGQYLIELVLKKILDDIEKIDPDGARGVKNRQNIFGYITKIVSLTEFIFFITLTVWFQYDNKISSEEVDKFLKYFAGWLAIKTIPNYHLWSHKEVGKSYFYRSLFGTVISIMFSIIAGFMINYVLVILRQDKLI